MDNTELDDFLTVQDYINSQQKASFILAISNIPSMTIHVLTSYKDEFEVKIEPGYTILDVKKKIECLRNIPLIQQQLFFNNKQLEDLLQIKEYSSIEDGSTIYLKIQKRSSQIIFIKTMENDLFEFEIEPKFTVHYLKTMIQEKIGFYPHQQNLIYNDIALDNSKTLEEYSINEKSIITLYPNCKSDIYIKVLEQNGN